MQYSVIRMRSARVVRGIELNVLKVTTSQMSLRPVIKQSLYIATTTACTYTVLRIALRSVWCHDHDAYLTATVPPNELPNLSGFDDKHRDLDNKKFRLFENQSNSFTKHVFVDVQPFCNKLRPFARDSAADTSHSGRGSWP
jgi:hypothetical protein